MQVNEEILREAELRAKELELLRVLPEVLTHHMQKRPDLPIYKQYDNRTKEWVTYTVREVVAQVERWKHAFAKMGLSRGDRVAMLMPNCIDAIYFDQAALACALVPVPLHAIDTPGSSAYILNDSEARVLVTNRALKWKGIRQADHLPYLRQVVITDEGIESTVEDGIRVSSADEWLNAGEGSELPEGPKPTDLAAIVYTSGTTGNPKGVMLTHRNVLSDLVGILDNLLPYPNDVWLSFLPLSHTFERSTSYYLALSLGNLVAFNRNIGLISDDLRIIRPSIMCSVPRIYEKIYAKIQDRVALKGPMTKFMINWASSVGYRRFCRENKIPQPFVFSQLLDPFVAGLLDKLVANSIRQIFGGRNRAFISGGAAFNPTVSRFFLSMGLNIFQGYGMTETSPVLCVNKFGDNQPTTVGPVFRNVQARIGENDELQIRGPMVMKGYFKREKDTAAIFTEDGWLRTGDQADIYSDGHVRIKGRIKEIIVTSTGEKIPPADLELAIENDQLFAQAMVVGDDRPYIAALVVLNPVAYEKLASCMHLDPKDPETLLNKELRNVVLRRVKAATASFPNYGVPRNVRMLLDPWTIDNGMLTPTLKLKRKQIRARYKDEIDELYGDIRSQR